jgi:hypothetical protein
MSNGNGSDPPWACPQCGAPLGLKPSGEVDGTKDPSDLTKTYCSTPCLEASRGMTVSTIARWNG